VIRSFRHKGIEKFFTTGSKVGIQPKHAKVLEEQLGALSVANQPADMNFPGWGFHQLKGNLQGHYAVWVNASWRLTFAFEGGDAILVNYEDYH
jgi:proteic killer suppression protein